MHMSAEEELQEVQNTLWVATTWGSVAAIGTATAPGDVRDGATGSTRCGGNNPV